MFAALLTLIAAGALVAPARSGAPSPARGGTTLSTVPSVSDTLLGQEAALARFQAAIPGPAPARLNGETSRAALVAAFVSAIENADTAMLTRLFVTRAEFAHLYFPTSIYTRKPYLQAPDLVWFRIVTASESGAGRLLGRDGGRPLGAVGHRCAAKPTVQNRNRIWTGCVVIVSREGRKVPRKLFGNILERDGRFKFLSLANEY